MKLLNLDDIAIDSQRTVKYRGVEYKVRDFTVAEYLKFQKHFNAFTQAYNSSNLEDSARVVEETKALVALGVDGMDPALVDTLNPLQMLALVSMIANLMPEPDAETAKEVATDEGKATAVAE